MLCRTISPASSIFRILGSRSQWLFLEKNFVITLAPTFIDGFLYNHTNVGYDNISSKFDFQSPGLKMKVTVAIFRNTVIALAPTFIDGF